VLPLIRATLHGRQVDKERIFQGYTRKKRIICLKYGVSPTLIILYI
jgi:hypothetical protein